MLERMGRSRLLNDLCLATSEKREDDLLASTVEKAGFKVFRGSLDNVLSRFWHVGQMAKAEAVVRLTGDCPLHDPVVVDEVVKHFVEYSSHADYVSNVLPPTYPDGLDTEVFTFAALDSAYHRATSLSDLEHVTPYIRREAAVKGRTSNYTGPSQFSHLRWTLDEPEDYELIRKVFEDLYPVKKDFGWLDVVAWQTQDPQRLQINSMHKRNEGLNKPQQRYKG
jgi:spore coat polysaccharide biosynthesis protein SpsF (cytidylyltransferase family)